MSFAPNSAYDGPAGPAPTTQNIKTKASTIFQGTAVFVRPAIFLGAEKLRHHGAVGGVQLHAVKTSFLSAPRSVYKCVRRLLNPLLRHCRRNDNLIGCFVDGVKNGGGGNGRLAANVLASVATAMANLDGYSRCAGMKLSNQVLQPRNKAVVINAKFPCPMPRKL